MARTEKAFTQYSTLYDNLYGVFAKQKRYKIKNEYKSVLMDDIFSTIPVDEETAIKLITKGWSYDLAAKIAKMEKKDLIRSYNLGIKHIMTPKCIAIAVNGYFDMPKNKKGTPLTKEDFGNRQYIVTALNRSGIEYREQLFKFLDNGWRYLWYIPGCGDNARMTILTAIDKWNGKSK